MSREVLVYSTPDCQACRMTKLLMRAQNISFEEIDVSVDRPAASMLQAAGHKTLPVVMTRTDVWTGFQPDRIRSIKHA